MFRLKTKLTRIATGELHNQPLVQSYLKDKDARAVGQLLNRLTDRQGTPALTLPAHAGLSLPRLDGIPARFSVDNEQATSAKVVLQMLEVGLVQEGDDEPHASPNTLVKNAVTRTLGNSLMFPIMELAFHITKVPERETYYLLVFVEGMPVIAFNEAAAVLDRVDPQLGPSLLGHVYKHLDLTPAFTPAVAKDLIKWQY